MELFILIVFIVLVIICRWMGGIIANVLWGNSKKVTIIHKNIYNECDCDEFHCDECDCNECDCDD